VLTPKVVGACADDSIESLGGDSLQAMDIQAELERQFSVAIPKELVESRPSIRACRRGRAPMNKTSHYNTPYGVFSRTIFRVAARLRRDPMIKTSDLATRLLHAAFPRLAFARNLCAIFERIPPAERPHSAFKDDPTKDVQIVAKNSDVLAVQSRFRDARLDMLEAYSNPHDHHASASFTDRTIGMTVSKPNIWQGCRLSHFARSKTAKKTQCDSGGNHSRRL
jgi:hypothetical protein